MITRRQFLLGVAGTVLSAGAGFEYVRRVEPRWLAVSHVNVPLRSSLKPAGTLRVLHLSDLHLSSVVPLEYIAQSIDRGLEEKPDLIAVTGDFYTGDAADIIQYAEVLSRLSAAAPTFACLGNHDGGTWSQKHGGVAMINAVLGLLARARITCLLNESHSLEVKGRRVQLFGVGDWWSGMCDPQAAFAKSAPHADALRLLLNHNPDAKTVLRHYDWDVMLCGHTHGGQVRIPLVGAPFAPVEDKRYLRGLYPWENRWMHITTGVGNLHGVRFNCRPEVSVLNLSWAA
ncbi:MAG: phosphodiesterase YaeI [Opitutus sp.]